MVGPIDNSVASTGAAVDLFLLPIPDESAYGITAYVVGFNPTTNEMANYEKKWSVSRFGAGVAVQLGATVVVIEQEDNAAWDMVCDVDGGNNARVQVTAPAGATFRGTLKFVRQPL